MTTTTSSNSTRQSVTSETHVSAPEKVEKTFVRAEAEEVGGFSLCEPIEWTTFKGVPAVGLRYRMLGVIHQMSTPFNDKDTGEEMMFLTLAMPNIDAKTTRSTAVNEPRKSSGLTRIQMVLSSKDVAALTMKHYALVYAEGTVREKNEKTESWTDASGAMHDPVFAFRGGLTMTHVETLGGLTAAGKYVPVIGGTRLFGVASDTSQIAEPFFVVGLPKNARLALVGKGTNEEGKAYEIVEIRWMGVKLSTWGFTMSDTLSTTVRVSARINHYNRDDGSEAATVKIVATK